MATYYWGNGNAFGTWNTTSSTNWWLDVGRTSPAASAPTAADDVIIDTTSGLGNILISGNCRDFTVTATQRVIILNNSRGNIHGNLTLPATGNLSTTAAGTPYYSPQFTATSQGKTITTNAKELGAATNFNGVNGGWTLGSDFNSAGTTLSNGNVTTNSYTWYGAINLGGLGTKSLTLGNTRVLVYYGGTPATIDFENNKTGFTFNANTSTLVFGGISRFLSGGYTFNVVDMGETTGSGFYTSTITGNNTIIDRLYIDSPIPGDVGHVFIGGNLIIGNLSLGNISQHYSRANSRISLRSSTTGSQVTLNVAAVSSMYSVDFRDIAFNTAVTGTYIGDCGNNSNITFDAPKTVYLVGNVPGQPNIRLFEGNNYAMVSNGTPSFNNFPLPQDTLIFDNASGNCLLQLDNAYNIGTWDMSARTSRTTTFRTGGTVPAALVIYGNMINSSTTTWNVGNGILAFSKRGTQTITSADRQINCPIVIDNFSGNLILNGDLFMANFSTHYLKFTSGTFDANGFNITTPSVQANATTYSRTVYMGSGIWNLTGTTGVGSSSLLLGSTGQLTWDSQTSTTVLSNDTGTAKNFTPTGIKLNKVVIGGTSVNSATYTITGNFAELAYTRTISSTLTFTQATLSRIDRWAVSGTAGNLVTVRSSSSTARAPIFLATKTSGVDYLDIDYINCGNATSGGGTPFLWYAGDNSVNRGTNSNIIFISSNVTSPKTVYLLTPLSNNNNPAGVWTVPSDWNSNNNIIHLIGPGGGGLSHSVSTNNRSAGGGGGGGAYVQLTNFTSNAGSNISFYVSSSATGANAFITGWNSNTYTANGGWKGCSVAGTSSIGGRGGAAAAVTGIVTASYAGGNGGAGAFGTVALTGYGSGGGGGAGGPNGKGGDGGAGFASTVAANIAGGGGGGGGGGSTGGNASASLSGAGGNNYLGTGGGNASTAGANVGAYGGGSAGARGTGGSLANPGMGIDIVNSLGSGGGTGGGGGSGGFGSTVFYSFGGGGAGSALNTAGTASSSGATGYPGAIIIVYSPISSTSLNSKMFFLF